jgi:hypothetical protein
MTSRVSVGSARAKLYAESSQGQTTGATRLKVCIDNQNHQREEHQES